MWVGNRNELLLVRQIKRSSPIRPAWRNGLLSLRHEAREQGNDLAYAFTLVLIAYLKLLLGDKR